MLELLFLPEELDLLLEEDWVEAGLVLVVDVVELLLFSQEENIATVARQTSEVRMDFFIGVIRRLDILHSQARRQAYKYGFAAGNLAGCFYSARSAIIGFTRVARRAGTKIEPAATAQSIPTTAQ